MATFKACVKTQRSDGLFAILIRITHNRTARYINTGKTIDKSKVRKGEIKDATILSYCSNLIKLYSERLNAVEITTWTANEIVSYLQNIDEDISFSKYARIFIIFVSRKSIANITLSIYRTKCLIIVCKILIIA